MAQRGGFFQIDRFLLGLVIISINLNGGLIMKLSLKVMSLAALIGMGNSCSASITFGYSGFRGDSVPQSGTNATYIRSVFNNLMNTPASTVPATPAISHPAAVSTLATTTPVSAPSALPASALKAAEVSTLATTTPVNTPSTLPASEPKAKAIEGASQAVDDMIKSLPSTPAPKNSWWSPTGWFNSIKNGLSDMAECTADCMPSKEALIKGAFMTIAAGNTYKRYCQARTAYNNSNINKCLKSSVLTAVSAAGTIMSVDACREKTGGFLSALLIAATAFDVVYQQFHSSKISQLDAKSVIRKQEAEQAIKCANCDVQILKAQNVNFADCDEKVLADLNEDIAFKDGDRIYSSGQNNSTVIYCKNCGLQ